MSLDDLWNQVRKDSDPTRWLITKANEKGTALELVKSDSTGFADFCKELDNTSGIVNAAIRIAAVDTRGSVRSIRYKFVRVVMITSDVGALKRAKAANVKAEADNLFNGTHATFDISEVSELTQDIIVKKLHNSAGAHQPNHYEFESLDDAPTPQSPKESPSEPEASKEEEKPTEEKKDEEDKKDDEKKEDTPEAPKSPEKKEEKTPGTTVDCDGMSVTDAWRKVLDDKEEINWIVVTYDGKNPDTNTLAGAGCGDLSGFKEAFDDSKVMYGGFRCSAIDDSGSVKSVRSKLIFVSFIGQNVKALARAKAGSTRGYFQELISGTHISVDISDADDLVQEDLVSRLQSCAGAHKPNGYDFSGKKQFTD